MEEKIMMHNEFETLTGCKVSPNKYELIEKVYMMTATDKQDFCTMWKTASPEAQNYMEAMALKAENYDNRLETEIDALKNEKKYLLNAMFERAQKMSDPVLRDICIEKMGTKEYLLKLIKGGYNLWEADKELLIDALEQFPDE